MAKHNDESQMRELLAAARALGDSSRLRALCALEGRELCVCQIVELLGLAPSTVSKHMQLLHQARLVDSRKDGRWVYYRLAGRDAPAAARGAVQWALRHASQSRVAGRDRQRLAEILETDPEELCRRQSKT
ncbi:MAG: ArsR/SmtB family transcription factor [Planctomycetota bacterium]|jgi:DNA-binding transcriptional ArsR family regulator